MRNNNTTLPFNIPPYRRPFDVFLEAFDQGKQLPSGQCIGKVLDIIITSGRYTFILVHPSEERDKAMSLAVPLPESLCTRKLVIDETTKCDIIGQLMLFSYAPLCNNEVLIHQIVNHKSEIEPEATLNFFIASMHRKYLQEYIIPSQEAKVSVSINIKEASSKFAASILHHCREIYSYVRHYRTKKSNEILASSEETIATSISSTSGGT